MWKWLVIPFRRVWRIIHIGNISKGKWKDSGEKRQSCRRSTRKDSQMIGVEKSISQGPQDEYIGRGRREDYSLRTVSGECCEYSSTSVWGWSQKYNDGRRVIFGRTTCAWIGMVYCGVSRSFIQYRLSRGKRFSGRSKRRPLVLASNQRGCTDCHHHSIRC